MNYIQYKVNLPLARVGKWAIEQFNITQEDADRFNLRERCNNHGLGYRGIEVGTYTRLCNKEKSWNLGVVMSDTPAEISDHMNAIDHAKGQVLITGLGIGVVLNACLMKPEVEHCTVIELESDVIALVASHYQKKWGDRLTIINEDAFKYQPPKGTKYDMIWHDIWPEICGDNYKDMKILKAKYKKNLRMLGWQGCWVEREVRRLDRINY